MSQEAFFTFTTPLNVNIVEIKGKEHTFVEGDISSNHLDFVRDIMSKNCQESMQRQIMERNMKLDIEHEAFREGKTNEEKEIAKTKIPAGKLIDATIKDLGENKYSTRVKGEINNNNKVKYEELKGNLVDKYLDAFSVAFLPVKVDYQNDEGKSVTIEEYKTLDPMERIRVLEDVILLNVALTGNACNTKAQLIEIVTKSMDALEEYKKLRKEDPSIQDYLIVKNQNQKQGPLSLVWDKIYMGELLTNNEQKLLESALKVVDNKGTESILAKEYMAKLKVGDKLTHKEYYIFKDLFESYSEQQELLMSKDKSYSTSPKGSFSQLNNKKSFNKKMTEEDNKPTEEEAAEAEKAEAEKAEVEKKSLNDEKAKLKSMSEGLKSLNEKYDVVAKDNVEIKEAMKGISESLDKITKALEQPIHKSPGVQLTDAEAKAKAGSENKSVDPLSLF